MKGTLIFVLDRGFIIVAKAELHPERAYWWHMSHSSTIRDWGTTKGLAELKDGPTSKTIMDEICERSVPERSIIDIIHLTKEGEEKWNSFLLDH